MTTKLKYRCRISERLDHIRITPAEREAAKAYLGQGVSIAEVIIRASAGLHSIAEHVGRGVRWLKRLTHRAARAAHNPR